MLSRDLPSLFSDVNHPARFYPVHPDEVEAYVLGGGRFSDIPRGRMRLRPDVVLLGNQERVKHVPTYRMETEKFRALGIEEDQCIEVEDPETCKLRKYRVAFWESDNHGLTTINLAGVAELDD